MMTIIIYKCQDNERLRSKCDEMMDLMKSFMQGGGNINIQSDHGSTPSTGRNETTPSTERNEASLSIARIEATPSTTRNVTTPSTTRNEANTRR